MNNLAKIDKLYKQRMRIFVRNRVPLVKDVVEVQKICQLCTLAIRRKIHLRNFMYNNRVT